MSGYTPSYRRRSREGYAYIAPDGEIYALTNFPQRVVLASAGEGMPPLNKIVQRGPFQHGMTLRSFFLNPRVVQLDIRQNGKDRDDYHRMRNALLDGIRPNRGDGSEGVLRKTLNDGSVRDLAVMIDLGPEFVARDPGVWDEYSFTESLYFVASNPVYYEPTVLDEVSTSTGTATRSVTVNYLGTWQEYPTIRLDGPMTAPTIENDAIEGFGFGYGAIIPAGHYVEIVLTYDTKTAMYDGVTNVIANLDGDLGTFRLVPGANVITATTDIGGLATGAKLTVSYKHRYIGI